MGVTKPTSVSKAVSVRLPPRVVAEIDARASKEALADMAKLAYDRAEQAGLVIKPDSFSRMVTRTVADVKREGIDKTIHPKATAAAQRLIKPINTQYLTRSVAL